MQSIAELMSVLPQCGGVVWIGVRPARRVSMVAEARIAAKSGKGLEGDRYAKAGGKRQVTLIQGEHLDALAGMLGTAVVTPDTVRRNVVVRGINLLALKGRRFRVGDALLEWSGLCHPCSRMEEVLGPGGYNAMRGHGGITARVVGDGEFELGSEVRVV